MASEQSNIRLRFVHGDIKNEYPAPLELMKNHDWSGHVEGSYSQVIIPKQSQHFNHDGSHSGPDGSKAAVVYTAADPNQTPDSDSSRRATFLVSWWRSVRLAKVYVKVGTRMQFENIDWSEIENELNKSGEESKYFDAYTRTGAAAKIGFDGKLEVLFGNGILP